RSGGPAPGRAARAPSCGRAVAAARGAPARAAREAALLGHVQAPEAPLEGVDRRSDRGGRLRRRVAPGGELGRAGSGVEGGEPPPRPPPCREREARGRGRPDASAPRERPAARTELSPARR